MIFRPKNRHVLPEISEEFQILIQQIANPSFIMVKLFINLKNRCCIAQF